MILIVIINKVLLVIKVECNEICKIFENVLNFLLVVIKLRVIIVSVILLVMVVYYVFFWEL